MDWRTFRFSNPTDYVGQQFNKIADAFGIGAAYYFIISGDKNVDATTARTALERAWNVPSANADLYKRVLNEFSGQGNPLDLNADEMKKYWHQERAYVRSLLG